MEINQATQTFLLFFFVFITSLLGFAIYIKKHEKLSKISLANAVQTSLLIVGIFTLLVFGGSYYFVLSDVKASEQPLKDALSITASFFGGFTTLAAAYIASRLFNDWRDVHNNTALKEIAIETYKTYNTLNVKLISINDVMVKSANDNKVYGSYDAKRIAEDIEPEVKEIGDLLALLIHQIEFIKTLDKNEKKEESIKKLREVILDYMGLMDISEYKQMNDHEDFINKEKQLKNRFDAEDSSFLAYIRSFVLVNF